METKKNNQQMEERTEQDPNDSNNLNSLNGVSENQETANTNGTRDENTGDQNDVNSNNANQLPNVTTSHQKEIEQLEKLFQDDELIKFIIKKEIEYETTPISVVKKILLNEKNKEEKTKKQSEEAHFSMVNQNVFMAFMFIAGMVIAILYLMLRK